MLLFVAANKTTTSANAIILQYIGPVFTAFIGAWLLKERAPAGALGRDRPRDGRHRR